ncbi:assimilatory nitrite reductase (NAD(P)H) small subunit [Sanguibacter gelidistatuariae]|uniref:Assimilatory nitrite reductase (NAD(P)H) small subunit n=1 Tax=Sanguibacter gelidistatuariae TaxID=1814289 RepID=A0A1G6HAD3_9MICO|nr:nitrite reductase small subunit NirD [Sanguibacter gelidistatuariae]SDB91113.1 assimilatory nitrite reductase (NAD(P)H) small subunit [Sanguibacter gelidistatuariae]
MTLDAAPHALPDADLLASGDRWLPVCALTDLAPERGAVALVDGVQVAVFRLADDTVHAVQQLDPFSGAYVMARGIVGTRGEVPTVASPMYKQVFDLRTGRCLETVGREPVNLSTWPVWVSGGTVYVDRTGGAGGAAAGDTADVAGAA